MVYIPKNSRNCALPLVTDSLSCRYLGGDGYALDNVNFTLNPATITGIVGPNGAGKSTFIKAVLGLIPSKGDVRFFDQPFDKVRQDIAYIPQRQSIDHDFPVSTLDVCLMGMYPRIGFLRRIKRRHRDEAMGYLEQVQMQDYAHRPIGALSGGQQQRVFVARALAQRASLFILDEPMAGIDQTTQTLLFDLFRVLTSQGKTILIVHHNIYTARTVFDDVMLLNKTVVAQGKPCDVLTDEMLAQTYNAV